jgi:hypothetical protein
VKLNEQQVNDQIRAKFEQYGLEEFNVEITTELMEILQSKQYAGSPWCKIKAWPLCDADGGHEDE